jgi:carbon-monoxide dehydrogenase small subunit/xanthine dehydrogenase YagT iron-sulfur-binding subunit
VVANRAARAKLAPMAHDDEETPGFSRRAFLRGTAGGAAIGGLVSITTKAAANATAPPVLGPGAVALELIVNGTKRKLKVEPRTTLAAALRDQLALTGTKIGCDRGACGACTVHLDGAPALACTTLAIEVGDRKVTTIEGLANGATLHPVQQAFIEQDAMQCGFCTPGMVMSCAALLAHNAKPDRAEIRQAVSGNLCRCGTYPKVFTAVMTASGQPAEGWTLETKTVGDGKPPPDGTAWVGIAGGTSARTRRASTAARRSPAPRDTPRTSSCRGCCTRSAWCRRTHTRS